MLTGVVQSLGTTWGLFRHQWVVAKLALTVVATIILLVHTQPIGHVAQVAATRLLSSDDLRQLRIQLIADAGAALMALLAATTLSVYKPWGLTRYGQRAEASAVRLRSAGATTVWTRLWIVGLVVAIALFVILHLLSAGLGHY